ncbi:right-handed parallel beta-helix repeat-containing protein [Kitasatospora sp. NPDC002227]|uniref:right-handed parallel beta-helix repeat-containing protein n=1 Tax=Kitasatospora sp. NPDC002227 TaxID=3154773 RepID=UPI003319715E
MSMPENSRHWGRRGFIGGLGAGTAGLIAGAVGSAAPAAAATPGAVAWNAFYVDATPGVTDVQVQAALDAARAAKGGQVSIGPGQVTLTKYLRIYANTRLTLSPGTVVTRSGANLKFMLMNGTQLGGGDAHDDQIAGYEGYGNIIVEGGVWDVAGPLATDPTLGYNGLQFVHARNITVQDLEVRNVTNWHAIKFQGVSNGTVRNCRFIGYRPADPAVPVTDPKNPPRRNISEAISLDLCWTGTAPGTNNTLIGVADNTSCADIRILDNHCDAAPWEPGSGYPVFTGSHSGALGAWQQRVEISGNTVLNTTNMGIYPLGSNQLVITNNRLHGCFGGIRVIFDGSNAVQPQPHPVWDFVVSGNTVDATTDERGIDIVGGGTDTSQTPAVPATAARAVITGNLVDGAKREGIHVFGAPDALITGNLVANVTVSPNSGVAGNGISVQNSTGANVTGNTVRHCDGYGVVVFESPAGASANGLITANSVSGTKLTPISVPATAVNVVSTGNLTF